MTEIENISSSELTRKWHAIKDNESGWVFYRLPGFLEVNFIAGKVISSTIEKISGNGYTIAQFNHPQNQLLKIENTIHFKVAISDYSALTSDFNPVYNDGKIDHISSKTDYEKLVGEIISQIEKGNLQKAVPARTKKVMLDPGFSPFELYESLQKAYPNAFVYILSTPQTGTWIGCTPEKLLQVEKNEINTMSLAGTKRTDTESQNFSAKETKEQDIVTRYIADILKKFCTHIISDGPYSINAGNVTHLATYFKGVLKEEFVGNYMSILKDLHPTPAVCGIPLNASRNFLLGHEKFDRSLYSGFMGPIGENKADIFVNLRCMQLFNQSALLYAGAGIVSGSIPENEWLETEEKMNTLLRFL